MSEWISVEERLPETDQRVLVYTTALSMTGVADFKDGGPVGIWDSHGIEGWLPTHWMPIPNAPIKRGPFFVGDSSTWPNAERVLCGVQHMTFGWLMDFRDRAQAVRVCDRLNEMWIADKGEKQ